MSSAARGLTRSVPSLPVEIDSGAELIARKAVDLHRCDGAFAAVDFDAFGNELDDVGVVPPAMFDLGFSLSSK